MRLSLVALVPVLGLALVAATPSVARAEVGIMAGAGGEITIDDYLAAMVEVHAGARLGERWWWMARVGHGGLGHVDPAGTTVTDTSVTEGRTGPTWQRCRVRVLTCWGTSYELGVRRGWLHQIDHAARPMEWDQRFITVLGDLRVRGQMSLIPHGRLTLEASIAIRAYRVVSDDSWGGGIGLGAAVTGRI